MDNEISQIGTRRLRRQTNYAYRYLSLSFRDILEIKELVELMEDLLLFAMDVSLMMMHLTLTISSYLTSNWNIDNNCNKIRDMTTTFEFLKNIFNWLKCYTELLQPTIEEGLFLIDLLLETFHHQGLEISMHCQMQNAFTSQD